MVHADCPVVGYRDCERSFPSCLCGTQWSASTSCTAMRLSSASGIRSSGMTPPIRGPHAPIPIPIPLLTGSDASAPKQTGQHPCQAPNQPSSLTEATQSAPSKIAHITQGRSPYLRVVHRLPGFSCRCGFSLLMYGLGSKKGLVEGFASRALEDGAVVVINGYFPSLSLKEVRPRGRLGRHLLLLQRLRGKRAYPTGAHPTPPRRAPTPPATRANLPPP